jgi:hypothetical protein
MWGEVQVMSELPPLARSAQKRLFISALPYNFPMTQRALVFFVLVTGVFAMAMGAFLLVEYAKSSDLRKAAEWHKVHGDVIIVDGHRLRLP